MNIAALSLDSTRHRIGNWQSRLGRLVKRMQSLHPRHPAMPEWSHLPQRAWRRHSALLTYLHEAQNGRH